MGGEFLREGREAIAAADWARARACFEEARGLESAPEALDGLSEVANFEGEYERAIGLKEEAFTAYRERDKHVEASHAARWLGFMHATYHGNYTVASGWIARAESLLEGVEECAAHGWLILDHAPFPAVLRSARRSQRRPLRSRGDSATPISSSRRSRSWASPTSRWGGSTRG
jgi:hypothetical protein